MTAIAFRDWVQTATYTLSNTANWTFTGTPANAQTEQLADAWGFEAPPPGAGPLELLFEFDQAKRINLVSLLDFRVEANPGFFQVELAYRDPGGSFLGLQYVDPDTLYPTDDFVRHFHAMQGMGSGVPLNAMATAIRLRVVSAVGAGTTRRMSIGRVWAGPTYVPPFGINTDWESSVADPGRIIKTRGGQGWPDRRKRTRRLSMAFSHVSFAQAFGQSGGTGDDLQTVGYAIGNTEPCIVLPRTLNPDGSLNTYAIHRLGVYGHAVSPMAIRHRGGDYYDASVAFEELF